MAAPADARETNAAFKTTMSTGGRRSSRAKRHGTDGALVGWGISEFCCSTGAAWLLWCGRCSVRGGIGLALRGRGIRGELLCKTLAETHAVVLASSSFHATLLGLGTAHSAAGTREVGEDSEVRGQIAWREPEVCVVEHVASVLMHSGKSLRHVSWRLCCGDGLSKM